MRRLLLLIVLLGLSACNKPPEKYIQDCVKTEERLVLVPYTTRVGQTTITNFIHVWKDVCVEWTEPYINPEWEKYYDPPRNL